MISVIVPLWNHLEDLTKPFVEKMLKCSGDFELILVDNGSKDGTKDWLKRLNDVRVRDVHSPVNLGFGGGNNLGYSKAKGDIICFISNDVIIMDSEFLVKIEKELTNNSKQLIGPMFVDYNTLTSWEYKNTPYLGGWCVAGTKELFDLVVEKDGFVWNEEFGLAYFEDVWLSQVVRDLGYETNQITLDLNHLVSKSSDQININEQMLEAQVVFRDKMLRRELATKNQKRIVFFAAGVPYPFVDSDYEQKGVGGAEASLILLARELATRGYRVEIYNRTNVSGVFNGVHYANVEEFVPYYHLDYFILFRTYHSALDYSDARVKIFWSCDQYTDVSSIWNNNVFPYVNTTVCISNYHKNYMKKHHNPDKIDVIDLGINYKDYAKDVEKVDGKAIFCSVPDRGLERLFRLAPLIKAMVPEFNLTVTSDYTLWGADTPLNQAYKNMIEGVEYVNFLGKVPRNELVRHQLESQIMAYPSNYPECFCISAMECMAAGAVPVTISMGALKETVGKGGIVLSNSVSDEQYINSIVDLLRNKEELQSYRKKSRLIGKKHNWPLIADSWIKLLKREELMPKKGVSKKQSIKKPMAELPKEVRLNFNTHVECNINGKAFSSNFEKGNHVLTVPSDYAGAVIQLVTDAYGASVII